MVKGKCSVTGCTALAMLLIQTMIDTGDGVLWRYGRLELKSKMCLKHGINSMRAHGEQLAKTANELEANLKHAADVKIR